MSTLGQLSHIALVVRDPARTAEFLARILGAQIRRHTDPEGHDETYVRLGETWIVLPEADIARELTGDHIAFRVDRDQLAEFRQRLDEAGHPYQMARADTALYFIDFDNHVFELECAGLPFGGI